MGRQMIFYMDKEIESQFINHILQKGYIFIYCDSTNKKVEIVEDFEMFESTSEYHGLYVYKESFGDLVFKSNCAYRLNAIASPVIELDRTKVRVEDKIVIKGRIWFEAKYYDSNSKMIEKTPELLACYNMLVRWVKKNVPYRTYNLQDIVTKDYMTDCIWDLIESGYILR